MQAAPETELLAGDLEPRRSGGLDIGQLSLDAVSRHPVLIVIFTLLGAIGGVFSALTKPNTYTSTGKVLVRSGARESLTPETMVQGDTPRSLLPGVLEERELFQDPALYEEVAREVGPLELVIPYHPAAQHAPDDQSIMARLHRFQSWWFLRNSPLSDPAFDPDSPNLIPIAAAKIQQSTTIGITPMTQVLTLSVSLGSPELAQRTMRALMHVHDARHRDIYKPDRQLQFITEQLESAKKQSAIFEQSRRLHEEECGFVNVDEEVLDLGQRIRDLQAQDDGDRMRLLAIDRELAFIAEQLATVPASIESVIPPQPVPNPRVAELMTELRQHNTNIQALSQSYAPDSALYRNQEAFLRTRMQAAERELRRTEPTLLLGNPIVQSNPNPRHGQFLGRRDELEQEQVRLRASLEARAPSLLALQTRFSLATKCSTRHNEFVHEAAEIDRRIGELISARERTEVLAVINDEQRRSNLVVLQEASLQPEKTGPKRAKPSMIGLALGCALGFGIALGLRFLDPKVRSAHDIESRLGLRVLGVVPEKRAWLKAGRRALGPAAVRG